jgi:hypothetical protein
MCWTKWHWDRYVSQYFSFSLSGSFISPTLRTHSSARLSYQKDKWAKPENLPTFGNRGTLDGEYFQFYFLFLVSRKSVILMILHQYKLCCVFKRECNTTGARRNFHLHRVQCPGIGKGRPQHQWTVPSNALTNVTI